MTSVLIDELKTLTTKIVRSEVDDVVGTSWAELAVVEDPRAKRIERFWWRWIQKEGEAIEGREEGARAGQR